MRHRGEGEIGEKERQESERYMEGWGGGENGKGDLKVTFGVGLERILI